MKIVLRALAGVGIAIVAIYAMSLAIAAVFGLGGGARRLGRHRIHNRSKVI